MLVSLLYVCLSVITPLNAGRLLQTIYGHNHTDIVKRYHRNRSTNVKVTKFVENS